MAAGLGFKTFVTGDVLTAADTNGYLMQGVLVFATAAARDSAITSPQEGQACYLKDTDAVMTYSGAAWVAVGSSALTKISTTTFSNVASQDIDNVFSSTYNAYLVSISQIYAGTQGDDLHLQMRYSTTTATTGYSGALDAIVYTGTSAITGANNAAQMLLSNACGASGFPTTATFNVVMPTGGGVSGRAQVYGEGFNALADEWNNFGYEITANQIYTGFRLKSSSSNITGTVVVYGLGK